MYAQGFAGCYALAIRIVRMAKNADMTCARDSPASPVDSIFAVYPGNCQRRSST